MKNNTCHVNVGNLTAKIILPLLMVTLGVRVYARTILVPTQPVSPYADTEVSTNVVIQTGRTDVRDVKRCSSAASAWIQPALSSPREYTKQDVRICSRTASR